MFIPLLQCSLTRKKKRLIIFTLNQKYTDEEPQIDCYSYQQMCRLETLDDTRFEEKVLHKIRISSAEFWGITVFTIFVT